MAQLDAIPWESFLRDDWQQRPRLFRQLLKDFEAPLSGEELAGLALESDVESRLVLGTPERGWRVRHGPFTEADFHETPDADWTLLVQDVEKHLPDLAWLVDFFEGLPAWRFDDLMVSYAAPGGSVGPHVDAYDVFLLQGSGRRHWWIDNRPDAPRGETDANGLRLLSSFTPNQDWILEPGDVLYLPPGVPHHGVALEACTTWSIGLRAPGITDILAELIEDLEAGPDAPPLLSDPQRQMASHPLEIDAGSRRRAREQLRNLLQDDRLLDRALGRALSAPKPGFLDLEPGPGEHRKLNTLTRDDALERNPAARVALLPADGVQPAVLYLNGQGMDIPAAAQPLIEALTRHRLTHVETILPLLSDIQSRTLLQDLLDGGYWKAL
ncbi:50S ribosomal protein L16 3-hydroxylase [Natronocella acetinitrilica]|uniref:50S ribosomal protein L16 3-hydroxylase n=1 Tax=Natronocella acetinitrilica TaxID=414046 RepID=A0AAE3KBP7_9GAMM|nr:cupin domain-containing protein [Natronocella acetinitrilica]MCP1675890.1 50S ribosomal protein L16 3-hydroxylase [Natronocella acetinitrilica]